jgi:hypothetical protein
VCRGKELNYFSFFSNEPLREETEEGDMTRKIGGGCYTFGEETMEIGGEV